MIKLGGLVDLKPITEADVFGITPQKLGKEENDKELVQLLYSNKSKMVCNQSRLEVKETDKPKVNIFNEKGGDLKKIKIKMNL